MTIDQTRWLYLGVWLYNSIEKGGILTRHVSWLGRKKGGGRDEDEQTAVRVSVSLLAVAIIPPIAEARLIVWPAVASSANQRPSPLPTGPTSSGDNSLPRCQHHPSYTGILILHSTNTALKSLPLRGPRIHHLSTIPKTLAIYEHKTASNVHECMVFYNST